MTRLLEKLDRDKIKAFVRLLHQFSPPDEDLARLADYFERTVECMCYPAWNTARSLVRVWSWPAARSSSAPG